jgi:hypothetical protein
MLTTSSRPHQPAQRDGEAAMGAVISLLLAGSVLVAVCWAGSERWRADGVTAARPTHPASLPTRLGAASAAAIAHPDGIPSIGRHDDRRCPH